MPRGDKTGPNGQGPKTGRGLGYCSGNQEAGFLNNSEPRQQMGRGMRNGRGNKNGFGCNSRRRNCHNNFDNYYHNDVDVSEKTIIQNTINILEEKLSALKNKLKNL